MGDRLLQSIPAKAPQPVVALRGKALVVDDDENNRMLLETMLRKDSFHVVSASNGAEAVESFLRETPDIIFMDVMMPVMDGYAAAAKIKAMLGTHFVPIIFVTVLSDDASLAKCIEAGGDGFLPKPFRYEILRSKIVAMERIRGLHERIRRQNDELNKAQLYIQAAQEVAEHILTRTVSAHNVDIAVIQSLLRPASTMNGDIFLTAQPAGRGLNVLMGDFSGHGLSASVGALPVSDIFTAMSAKGLPMEAILHELELKLAKLLPKGMFLAATFINISHDLQMISVWNGGLPDLVIFNDNDKKIRRRFSSQNIPLGIMGHLDHVTIEQDTLQWGDRLFIYSDGLIEACDVAEVQYGEDRLFSVIESDTAPEQIFNAIVTSLDKHIQGTVQVDDISLVTIPVVPQILYSGEVTGVGAVSRSNAELFGQWSWAVEVHGQSLNGLDPVASAMTQIAAIKPLQPYMWQLQSILTELYSNALDHGLLELDSGMKATQEGFFSYYSEREKRLQALSEGWIRLEMTYQVCWPEVKLRIVVKDSGKGFDYQAFLAQQPEHNEGRFSGRGIYLVRSLAESLVYKGTGNEAEVIYNC